MCRHSANRVATQVCKGNTRREGRLTPRSRCQKLSYGRKQSVPHARPHLLLDSDGIGAGVLARLLLHHHA